MYCYIKGRRKRGRPPKKWIDNIKEDVKLMELSIGEAVNLTRDREKWRIVSCQAHRQPTADGREKGGRGTVGVRVRLVLNNFFLLFA